VKFKLGRPDGQGIVRAFIATWLVGMLVGLQFWTPPAEKAELVSAARTLAVVVVAFYFGQRLAARREVSGAPERSGTTGRDVPPKPKPGEVSGA
jgi:hypothetical protein